MNKRQSNDWRVRLGIPGAVIFGGNLLIWMFTGDTRYHDRSLFLWVYLALTLASLSLLGWWILRRPARM